MEPKIIRYFRHWTNIFKKIDHNNQISEWKSKALFDEVIKPPATDDNGLTPASNYAGK